jgi:non-homologous end joining protein Ku
VSSPRTMWSGVMQIGMVSAPVTVGRAWSDERETSLLTLCAEHHVPIDRTERCGAGEQNCSMTKVRGVATQSGGYKALDADEFAAIEESTKDDSLTIYDVQPLTDLPMEFSTGTYYVRADTKAKGKTEEIFATFALALAGTGMGLVTKWCRSAKQRLCVISAYEGMLILRTLPMENELRLPGKMERAHFSAQVPDAQVQALTQLFALTRSEDGFVHEAYRDHGLEMRQAAVEKILDGEVPQKQQKAPEKAPATDLMAMMQASIDAAKAKA